MKPRHFIACFLFAVFIAYPLSIGPAVILNMRYNDGKTPSWAVVYMPLIWACKQYQPLEIALAWYEGKCAALAEHLD